jgi:uncharacterized protein (TIRG00374 family)
LNAERIREKPFIQEVYLRMTGSSLQPRLPTFTWKHAARYLVILIVLGLAVHLLLPQIATLERSLQVIRGMFYWAVALAALAEVSSYLSSGLLLKEIVKLSDGKLSAWRGAMITLAGASFGMVAGGMVGSAAAIFRWMQKEKIEQEVATLAGTIPAVLIDLVLVAVSLVGLVHLLLIHQLARWQGISFLVILVVLLGLIGLLVWGLRKREALQQWAAKIGRWWAKLVRRKYQPERTAEYLEGLFDAADTLLSGGWRGPLLGASLTVAFDMLTLYFLFIAAGHPVRLGVLLTGYGLPLLFGKMAFMIPGGVGVIESTMAGIYASLGVQDAVTVVVVLAYRVLSFWIPLLLGFPLILVLERQSQAD